MDVYDEERGFRPIILAWMVALLALCVQPGDLLVAQNRAGLRGALDFRQ